MILIFITFLLIIFPKFKIIVFNLYGNFNFNFYKILFYFRPFEIQNHLFHLHYQYIGLIQTFSPLPIFHKLWIYLGFFTLKDIPFITTGANFYAKVYMCTLLYTWKIRFLVNSWWAPKWIPDVRTVVWWVEIWVF